MYPFLNHDIVAAVVCLWWN